MYVSSFKNRAAVKISKYIAKIFNTFIYGHICIGSVEWLYLNLSNLKVRTVIFLIWGDVNIETKMGFGRIKLSLCTDDTHQNELFNNNLGIYHKGIGVIQ